MSVKSFKFVSPGVFINEIDNSQLPRLPDQLGPVLIGRAERGPSMVPVQVDSFSEFVEIFGEPVGGGESEDSWRNGNRMGPTYAAFAAQAYLRSSSPLTFIRLLGLEAPDAAESGKAGWKTDEASLITVTQGGSGPRPLGIVYHATGVTVSTAAAGNRELTVTLTGAGSSDADTPGSATLTATSMFSAADLPGLTITLRGKGDTDAVLTSGFEFAFDASVLANVYDATGGAGSKPQVTIGIAGTPSVSECLDKIVDAVNNIGADLAVTASRNGLAITFVTDEAGAPAGASTTVAIAGESEMSLNASLVAGVDGGAAADKVFKISMDVNSKKYIRSVMNTNPTLMNSSITDQPEKYFLGPTFDQDIARVMDPDAVYDATAVASLTAGDYAGLRQEASAAATPWVYGQWLGDPANYVQAELKKLFKVHALYSGEWEQKNFKISITDIAPPKNAYTKYGTFSLEVRRVEDSDSNPQIVERFTGLTLDPASPSFVAAKVGDMRMEWVAEEARFREFGEHANVSKYIRIEVATDVATGAANPELLPFGYSVMRDANGPNFSLRLTTKGSSKLSAARDAYFGVSTDRTSDTDSAAVKYETHDASFCDIVRTISINGADTEQTFFSLDFITASGSDAVYNEATASAGLITGTSINGAAESFSAVLEAGFDKFTLPLQGGADGLDILEIEPFNSRILSESATPQTQSAYYTVKRAVDTLADPEFVECNMMAMPGISNPGLTGHMINVCEQRADALAVIDIEDDYTPAGWDKTISESDRLPNCDAAVRSLKDRAINSSYGCAYFPWVQIRDNLSNKLVWVPPSVAAIGTMASSASNSELWFAPAGFTRGGLTSGAAGLPVIQTRYRLNSKERDKLYEANVNPIAQFPAEGIVIFGQKTLQVTPSALDRINVRRLMIFVKKEISRMASTLLFDQNVDVTWARFKSKAEPFLTSVKSRFGLTEYRIILDETTTTPELVDRNIMYAKIFLKPARAIEFIAIDFVITNSGASFDD